MSLKELVTGKSGEKQFLLGNEAAVRGVIEGRWRQSTGPGCAHWPTPPTCHARRQ